MSETRGGWDHALNLVAYSDGTGAEVRYTDTGSLVWGGSLDAGDVQSITGLNGSFVTVTSDKGITVLASPYGAYSDGYYHAFSGADSTGTGIGTLFHLPVVGGGSLTLFSYEADSEVVITDADDQTVWSGVLDLGETYSFTANYAIYTIASTGPVSAIYDWGDAFGADFTPVFYGGASVTPRGAISLFVSDFYEQDEPISTAVSVDNPGATEATYTVAVSLLLDGGVVESHSDEVTVASASCSLPVDFDFTPQPPGTYTLLAELTIGAELLASESRSVDVLDADQLRAAIAVGELTDRALAELNQTEEIAVDVLSDGIKRVSLDPAKWSAEQVLQVAGKAVALHFGASTEAVDAINAAIKLTMTGVKQGFSDPVEERATEAAEVIVRERLDGRSDEVLSQEADFIAAVADEGFAWDWGMDLRTTIDEYGIRTIVEVKPFFSVNGLPPFVRFVSFLGQQVEYWAWETMSWAVSAILVVLAAAILIAFILATFHISVPALIAGLAAAAGKAALALKTAGLINAVVVPVMMLSAALSMTATADEKVAPAIVEAHGEALDGLLGAIQESFVGEAVDFGTRVEVDGYEVSFFTEATNQGARPVTALVETYLYSVDGSLVEILAGQPHLGRGESEMLEEQLSLPRGRYRAVTVLHSRDATAVRAQEMTLEVSVPEVRLTAYIGDPQISLGERVNANISVANTDSVSGTGELTLFALASDGQNFGSWSVDLPASGAQDVSYSFAPQAEGGYLLQLRLTDGMSVLARQDLGYVVGQGVALAINAEAKSEYSPGQDVTFPITATNAGNMPGSALLLLETLSAQDEYATVHTTSVDLSLDAGTSEAVSAVALPDAEPGTYLTRMLLDDVLYDAFEFSVAAEDTVYAHIAPDAYFHTPGDTVTLTVQVANSSYEYVDADPMVTVVDAEGVSHSLSVSHVSTGVYQRSLAASIEGTYKVNVGITKAGYRTVPDSSFFVTGRAGALVPSVSGSLFQGQTNALTVTVTAGAGLPVAGATVELSGTYGTFLAVTDLAGQAFLSVRAGSGEEQFHGSVRRVGYLNAYFNVPVTPALDTEPPFVFYDSVFDGQSVSTSPVTLTGSTEVSSTLAINGQPVPVDSEGGFATSMALTEGENLLTAVAEDRSDNSATVTITLYLDTEPPPLVVVSPHEGLETTDEVVNIIGETEADASVSVGEYVCPVDSGGSFGAWIMLDMGTNSVAVVATDAAGNSTAVTRELTRIPHRLYLPCVLEEG